MSTVQQRIQSEILSLPNDLQRQVLAYVEWLKYRETTMANELTSEQNRILAELHQPLDESIDLNAILKEQNYTGPNKRRFQRLVKKLDIQEPIEDLLALLAK